MIVVGVLSAALGMAMMLAGMGKGAIGGAGMGAVCAGLLAIVRGISRLTRRGTRSPETE
jgi:hypothetical protein